MRLRLLAVLLCVGLVPQGASAAPSKRTKHKHRSSHSKGGAVAKPSAPESPAPAAPQPAPELEHAPAALSAPVPAPAVPPAAAAHSPTAPVPSKEPTRAPAAIPAPPSRPAPSAHAADRAAPAAPLEERPESVEATTAPGFLRPNRVAVLGGGAIALGAVALTLFAQSEQHRADGLADPQRAGQAHASAQSAWATAEVGYGIAGAAILYGLVVELLPEPAADKARLTWHF